MPMAAQSAAVGHAGLAAPLRQLVAHGGGNLNPLLRQFGACGMPGLDPLSQ